MAMGMGQFDEIVESCTRRAALGGAILVAAVIDIKLEASFDTDLVTHIPSSQHAVMDVANEALAAYALTLAISDPPELIVALSASGPGCPLAMRVTEAEHLSIAAYASRDSSNATDAGEKGVGKSGSRCDNSYCEMVNFKRSGLAPNWIPASPTRENCALLGDTALCHAVE